MTDKYFTLGILLLTISFHSGNGFCAALTIESEKAVKIELKGFDGLEERLLFAGSLSEGRKQVVETHYRGMALLVLESGQNYPLFLEKHPLILELRGLNHQPSFIESKENTYFYELLEGGNAKNGGTDIIRAVINAKSMLEATYSIKTLTQLAEMKENFLTFVRDNYTDLQHTDMLMRLMAQYFMMHEYVSYHIEGIPAMNIQKQYEDAVMDSVQDWLTVLTTHIPQHEVLNSIISLYYDRSMVTLASKIIEHFKESAYCPGGTDAPDIFSDALSLTGADGSTRIKLHEVTGSKILAFVSDDCPVSLVEAVMKARHVVQKKGATVIVVPLEPLNEHHLSMPRMVSGGNMLFVDDEKWRKENLPEKLRLPHFVQITAQKRGQTLYSTR